MKGPNSDVLRFATAPTVACTDPEVINGNLCVNVTNRNVGICTSDVGGPLIANGVLIGIASWHNLPCASSFVRELNFIYK